MEKCYCGYLKDERLLTETASGGLATALGSQMIREGGIVYGVVFRDDFKGAQWLRATDSQMLQRLKGSKYVKADNVLADSNENVYRNVVRDLQENRKVLFVGLPCEVGALVKLCVAENVCTDNLLTVDLICQGPPSSEVLDSYVCLLEERHGARICSLHMRYKNPLWKPPFLRAEFTDGQEYMEKLQKTEFWTAFNMMPQLACYQCKFKGENHASHMTIGDCWGIKETETGYDDRGVSVAFIHSLKADDFLQKCEDFFFVQRNRHQSLEANPRYSSSVIRTAHSDKFRRNFQKGGLVYACKKNNSLKRKLVRILPKSVGSALKKILKNR